MNTLIHTLLLVLSIVIIAVVMLQSKGTGLSIVPGSNDFGKFERRGAEKTLHTITIGLVVLFVGLATVSYFIS
jgi:protein translocase SecG subunit